MRLARTLSVYVLREVLLYTALALVVVGMVLISRNLLRNLDEVIAAGASASDVLRVLACLVSVLATYAIPLAFLFGVMLAMRRLAADVEITAMRSCGVGLPGLLLPVAFAGLAISGATAYLTLEVEHRAQRELRMHLQSMAVAGRVIQPGEFRRVGERVLFVKRRGADDSLEGIVIADRSDPKRPLLIFAEDGNLDWDPDAEVLRLRLRRGDIHIEPTSPPAADAKPGESTNRYQRIAFTGFDYALEADEVLGVSLSAYRPREMSGSQLRTVIARARAGDPLAELRRHDPVYYQLQLQRRLALPVAPLLFALVGVPLGARRSRGGRSFGILLCGLLAGAYYALLSLGQALATAGMLPAVPAAWLANATFGLAAGGLLLQQRRFGASE